MLKLLFLLFYQLSAMDCYSRCTLFSNGKSLAENEIAEAIKSDNTLKLPENGDTSIVLHSELEKARTKESFEVDSFMNSLRTNKFGRFFIWFQRLSSTHDVDSQYVLLNLFVFAVTITLF